MKKILSSFVIGILLSSVYFLFLTKKEIVYVPVDKIIEKPVDKLVYVPSEPIEKIIYKKRSCNYEKEKICKEYIEEIAKLSGSYEKVSSDLSLLQESKLKTSFNKESKIKKNRVNVHLGFGTTGYTPQYDGSKVSFKKDSGIIYGLQYEHKFDKLNSSLMIQSNSTVSLGLGADF